MAPLQMISHLLYIVCVTWEFGNTRVSHREWRIRCVTIRIRGGATPMITYSGLWSVSLLRPCRYSARIRYVCSRCRPTPAERRGSRRISGGRPRETYLCSRKYSYQGQRTAMPQQRTNLVYKYTSLWFGASEPYLDHRRILLISDTKIFTWIQSTKDVTNTWTHWALEHQQCSLCSLSIVQVRKTAEFFSRTASSSHG
jgi:hypothetical protein